MRQTFDWLHNNTENEVEEEEEKEQFLWIFIEKVTKFQNDFKLFIASKSMRLRNAFERIETEWQYIKKQEFKWEKKKKFHQRAQNKCKTNKNPSNLCKVVLQIQNVDVTV